MPSLAKLPGYSCSEHSLDLIVLARLFTFRRQHSRLRKPSASDQRQTMHFGRQLWIDDATNLNESSAMLLRHWLIDNGIVFTTRHWLIPAIDRDTPHP